MDRTIREEYPGFPRIPVQAQIRRIAIMDEQSELNLNGMGLTMMVDCIRGGDENG